DFSPDTYIYPEHEVFGRTGSRHATMIRRVDDVLKDMIQLLKDLGIDDNTMIVFTSDNGPHNEPGSGNYGNGAQDPAYFMSYGMRTALSAIAGKAACVFRPWYAGPVWFPAESV
ncbi:sulfatase-like hydrolase/transferase, partial [Escherichia coli]|nr:sulfatase-like hydrolase/transferase [Escherichia coli]